MGEIFDWEWQTFWPELAGGLITVAVGVPFSLWLLMRQFHLESRRAFSDFQTAIVILFSVSLSFGMFLLRDKEREESDGAVLRSAFRPLFGLAIVFAILLGNLVLKHYLPGDPDLSPGGLSMTEWLMACRGEAFTELQLAILLVVSFSLAAGVSRHDFGL